MHFIKSFIIGFVAALLYRCPKCWGPIACERDWSNRIEGYGLYYCPKCDGHYKM